MNVPPSKDLGKKPAAWHDALLEANRMVTKKNLARQDSFLNPVENRLDEACLGVLDLIEERDALREAVQYALERLTDNGPVHLSRGTTVTKADELTLEGIATVLDRALEDYPE